MTNSTSPFQQRPALPARSAPSLIALASLLIALGDPAPAVALDIRFIPRSQADAGVDDAFFRRLSDGEVDIDAGAGATEGTGSVASTDATTTSTGAEQATTGSADASATTTSSDGSVISTDSLAPSDSTTDSTSFAFGDAEPFDGGFFGDLGDGFGGSAGGGGFGDGGQAQIPSAGAPASGSQGIPGNGWGTGLPDAQAPGPSTGFRYKSRIQVNDLDLTGDPMRSTQNVGTFYRNDGSLSWEATRKDGVQMRFQSNTRTTDDPAVFADGNKFRLEGQFFEAARAKDFLLRVGDIAANFTNYTYSKTGDGVQFIKNQEKKDGLIQIQFFGTRTAREKNPGTFRRESSGARAARVWRIKEGEANVGVGAQMVVSRDITDSLTPFAAAGAAHTPHNQVTSVNTFYDNRQGLHVEGEVAASTADLNDGNGSVASRQGGANRQSIGYTRSGKSITLDREHVHPNFNAIDAGSTPDIERQSIFLNYPINQRFTVTSFYQRVYNDVENVLGRTGANKAHNLALTMVPFVTDKRDWLRNLNMGVAGNYSRTTSSDDTANRFDRDYTYSLSDTIGRLTLSYTLRSALNTDYLFQAGGRAPHNSSYQAGYDILSKTPNQWKLSPFMRIGHDRDRIFSTFVIDRNNDLSLGFNGNWGSRSTFSVSRDERVGRTVSAMRNTYSNAWRGQMDYLIDQKSDTKATMQFSAADNYDSGQAALFEDRFLMSIERTW